MRGEKNVFLTLSTANRRIILKKTFVQFAGIIGIVAVIISTLNVDALASRRHHRHYVRHHHHGHRS